MPMNRSHYSSGHFLLLCTCCLLLVACSGSGGDEESDGDNADDDIVISGKIVDEDGHPVADALVTVAGIEADTVTNNKGEYEIVTPYEPDSDLLLTAQAPNFEPLVTTVQRPGGKSAKRHELGKKQVKKGSKPNYLAIATPVDDASVIYDPCQPEVTVSGAAGHLAANSPLIDVVVLIDASGSTSRQAAGSSDSIYDQQLDAVRDLIDSLCNGLARVALVKFAGEAELAQSLTNDNSLLDSAIDDLESEGPTSIGSAGSGTNFAAAMSKAQQHFDANPLTEIDGEDGVSVLTLERRKIVMLISDGIPTLPYGSGLTQQKQDVQASLNSAQDMDDDDITVHTVAVEVAGKDRTLTTMPSIAHITGGSFEILDDTTDLGDLLEETGLTGIGSVRIHNPATGDSVTVTPGVDGCFSGTVSIAEGTQTIEVTAFRKKINKGLTKTVTIHAVNNPAANTPLGLDPDGDIATIGDFTSPYGRTLNKAHSFGVHLLDKFPDLHESVGTQVFTVVGTPGADVTVDVEMVARHAGWRSAIGFLELTPTEAQDVLSNTEDAFAAATEGANVLWTRSDFTGVSSSKLFEETGGDSMTASFTTKAGNYIVFFLVANGDLAAGQSGSRATHYTTEPLNGGGFDQVLTYWSEDGWDGGGDDRVVVVIEDMPMVHRSDRDFWDVAFAASDLVPGIHNFLCPMTDN